MARYKRIRYGFRPESYWVDQTVRQSILRNVTGSERRRIIDQTLARGQFDQIPEALTGAEVSPTLRRHLGRIHPCLMGGEYLPGYLSGETEIGRIGLASTTSDVISIRARFKEGQIHYRIVDEYKGDFSLACESSQEPFSLEEFIDFIEGSELSGLDGPLSLCYNEYNLEYHDSPSELRHFTTISSDVYRQLYSHYELVYDDWVAEWEEEFQIEDEDEDEVETDGYPANEASESG